MSSRETREVPIGLPIENLVMPSQQLVQQDIVFLDPLEYQTDAEASKATRSRGNDTNV